MARLATGAAIASDASWSPLVAAKASVSAIAAMSYVTWAAAIGAAGCGRCARAVYQVGSALGFAAIMAVATTNGADCLGDAPAPTDGYSAAFLGAAGVAIAVRCSPAARCPCIT
jgi:hypothetical protein